MLTTDLYTPLCSLRPSIPLYAHSGPVYPSMATDNSNHAITQVQTVTSANTVNKDPSQLADQITAPCDLSLKAPAPTSPQYSNWVTSTDPNANQLTIASQSLQTSEDAATIRHHLSSTNSTQERATTSPSPQRKRKRTHRMCKWTQADPRTSSSHRSSNQTSPCHQLPNQNPPQGWQSAPGTLPNLDFLLAHRGLLAPLLATPMSTNVPSLPQPPTPISPTPTTFSTHPTLAFFFLSSLQPALAQLPPCAPFYCNNTSLTTSQNHAI